MPISIGVFGNWGAGKSTILELTKNALEKEEQEYIQVHFDAWTFQGYDDAKAALLETIASELEKKAEGNKNLVDKAKEFSGRVDKIRLMGLIMDGGSALAGFPTFGVFQKLLGDANSNSEDQEELGFEDIKSVSDETGKLVKKGVGIVKPKKKFSPPAEIREFRKAYSSLLEGFNKPLVVYVDNLDRCSPMNAISTLEAIRLFLFLPNTAFVIAADEDMIRLAIPHFHKGASQRHQTDYLDKLIQIPVHVPKPGAAEVRAYLMMLIVQDQKIPEVEFEKIRLRLEESLRLSWKQAPITVDELLSECTFGNVAKLRNELKVAEQLSPILAESSNISGNPRIVKRLLNQVRMRRKTALRRGMQLDEKMITKLVIFERCMGIQATNKLYELIDKGNGKPKLLAELEDSETEIEDIDLPDEWKLDLDFLGKWSKLQPFFTGVDLTAAVYLSRQSIPMGSINSVISGAAQNLLDGLLKQKNRLSETNSQLVEVTGPEEYLAVMDGLIEKLKLVEEWNKIPLGIYGARLLALKDAKSKSAFMAYIKTIPKQRWLSPITKELEGAN